MRANGLIVFIPKFGIEGVVHLTPKEDKKAPSPAAYKLDEERQTVTSADGALAFTVFDKVMGLVAPASFHTGLSPLQCLAAQSCLRRMHWGTCPEPLQLATCGRSAHRRGVQVAVRISIEEGYGHRRHMVLELVDRSELPASEEMA